MVSFSNQSNKSLDQLAMLTAVRMLISDVEEDDMGDVLKNTSVMSIVSQTLQMDSNTHTLARYMKLESLWILVNLAMGNAQDIQKL